MESKKTPIYVSKSIDGHRLSYLNFVVDEFGGSRLENFWQYFSSRPLFFLMIEESFVFYIITAIIRSILGHATIGLLFRPKPAVHGGSIKLKIKKHALIWLKKFPKTSTLSIVPFSLDKKIELIADNWIYDFQLWDLNYNDKIIVDAARDSYSKNIILDDDVMSLVRKKSRGKNIVISLGLQDKNKGFDIFNNMSNIDGIRENWYFVAAGIISTDCDTTKYMDSDNLLVINRRITDEELFTLYGIADVIWCAYSESYDQASGILGRAIQLGKLVVVREGSYSEAFCFKEEINCISISMNSHDGYKNFNKSIVKKENIFYGLSDAYRNHSVRVIKNALCR